MTEKPKWYQLNIVQEAIFFVAIFFLTTVQQWIQLDTLEGFLKGLVFFLIVYIHAQLHRLFVFPLLINKRYGLYAIISIVSAVIVALLLYVANRYWISPHFYKWTQHFFKHILYLFVISVTSMITIMGLFLTRRYQTELQKRNQDQILLNEMNIRLLHAQLNPHFFFNMFNNLYGVSLTSPERTPDLILKLSSLMRYQLATGNKTQVNVAEEVNFISNYIVMERERVGKRCEIVFECPEEGELLSRYRIAPLILITLVENAFKHSLTVAGKWFVHIYVRLADDVLNLNIVNSLPDDLLKQESTGLGLQNVSRRLELLYNGRYSFEAGINGHVYQTDLTIKLNQSFK